MQVNTYTREDRRNHNVYKFNPDSEYALVIRGDALNGVVEILRDRHEKDIRNHKIAAKRKAEVEGLSQLVKLGHPLTKVQKNLLDRYYNEPGEFTLPFTVARERPRTVIAPLPTRPRVTENDIEGSLIA